MLDLNEVRATFSTLSDITPLSGITGQRDVCRAKLGTDHVALKIFKKSAKAEERMNREVAAIAKLGSSVVPKIRGYGKRQLAGEERLFIIEDWIDGSLLSDLFQKDGRWSLDKSLELMNSLLTACLDFENKQLVHRDIKPNNLMVASTGKLWVLDFGIVRHLDLVSLTETEHMFGLGTFGYGAPEQMRNLKVNINSRADLFSIGVVVYQSLAGSNPYIEGKGGNPLRIIQHVESQNLPRIAIPGDNGQEFSDFIMALVERFPSRRPQTVAEALDWYKPIYGILKK